MTLVCKLFSPTALFCTKILIMLSTASSQFTLVNRHFQHLTLDFMPHTTEKDKYNHQQICMWRWCFNFGVQILNLQKNSGNWCHFLTVHFFRLNSLLLPNHRIRSFSRPKALANAFCTWPAALQKKIKLSSKKSVRFFTMHNPISIFSFQLLSLALVLWDVSDAKKLIGSASTSNRNVNFIDDPSNFAIGKSKFAKRQKLS